MAMRELLEPSRVALYVNVGCELLHYDVDLQSAALVEKGSVTLPAIPQYAWPHASRRYLYVACGVSNNLQASSQQYLTALRIDSETGSLCMHGEPVQLPARPVHLSTDIPSEHVLVAFNAPSDLRVFRINEDATVGQEIAQPAVADCGIYAHQIRVTPDNRHAVLVTRGNDATATKPEDPGALKMFDYDRGMLSNETSIAPNGGIGFGPRHLDFHPARPWAYVSLERQNKIYTYQMENGTLTPEAAYRNDTLAEPGREAPHQLASAIHVHPNGRFVYVSNRAGATTNFDGREVFAGGENSIAVYSIDQMTGEPRPIQFVDFPKFSPRSFQIEPGGRLMVVHNNVPMHVREGNDVREVKAGMTLFRIGDDGKLVYARTYDLEGTKYTNYWMGMVGLP